MLCAILAGGKPTGQTRPVVVVEVKRDHATQEPTSVRVRTLTGKTRTLWVQPQYLSARPTLAELARSEPC